ncbi:substrate-binding domain-containing protein [Rhizorhapis sp.]|uniref:substrate-binding domain-containing protein n=1 Tax=Rhizorhapis sp. TaxID=1968842 RepID=UPI0039C9F768
MIKNIAILAVSALALAACQDQAGGGDAGGARDQIRAVGSSTVFPFATAVAEQFVNNNPGMKSPIIESTGTGAGIKLFCAGVGAGHPDIENASRRMKASEFEMCQKNGVKDIVEVQVGIDGLAFAESNKSPKFKLTPKQIYEALAATPYGKEQKAEKWSDVDPSLPATTISVFGPPSTSGTRDAFAELILEKGCKSDPAMEKLKDSNEDKYKEVCTKVREDGKYVDSGENDNLIVQKLGANPDAVGIFGYSFLEENLNSLHGIPLNDVEPTYQNIADGKYPGARPLYIYVKKAHVTAIPGLKEYMAEFANAWGPDGYLVKRGLIAAPEAVRKTNAEIAKNLTLLNGADLK